MTNEINGKSVELKILSPNNIEDPTFDGLIIVSSNGQLLNYRRHFSSYFMRHGGTYSENQKTWGFPSGARITFGIVKNQGDSNKFPRPTFQSD